MIIKPLGIEFYNLASLEEAVVRLCQNRFVDIEFDQNYEPEIKIRFLYDYFKSKDENSGIESKVSETVFLELLYGILKRYETTNSNFDIFYSIILAIEIIRPLDSNSVLRGLINDAKFIHCQSESNNFNIHLKLLEVYLNLVSDSDNINFVGDYFLSEVSLGRLFKYPLFFSIYLRYYIKFKTKEDFFWALEKMIIESDSEEKIFQLILSVDEYTRYRKTYRDLYHWLKSDFVLFRKNTRSEAYFSFVNGIYDWSIRRKNIDNNKYLDLILAEDVLIRENNSIEKALPFLQNFCAGDWEDKRELEIFGTEFCNLLNDFEKLGYKLLSDTAENKNVITLFFEQNISEVFSKEHKPLIIKVPYKLFYKYVLGNMEYLLPQNDDPIRLN